MIIGKRLLIVSQDRLRLLSQMVNSPISEKAVHLDQCSATFLPTQEKENYCEILS